MNIIMVLYIVVVIVVASVIVVIIVASVIVVIVVVSVVIVDDYVLFLGINVLLILIEFDILSIIIVVELFLTNYLYIFVHYLLTYSHFLSRNTLVLVLLSHKILIEVTIFSLMEVISHIVLFNHLILLTLLSLYLQPIRCE